MAQTEGKRQKSMEPEHITASANGKGEGPVIQTIPEKFYGAALRAKISTSEKKEAPKPTVEPGPAKKKGILLPMILVVLLLLVGAGAVFVYFNQELLFGEKQIVQAPAPLAEPPKPAPPPPPPAAPTDVTATAISFEVIQLNWKDASENESGFRIERRDPTSDYRSITSLPPGSEAYQDQSVSGNQTYLYRVVAINEGGPSPASNEVTVETPEAPPPPPEPVTLPPAGLDSDSDGLTDLEEQLYGTSPRDPDVDRDTFLDGNEVFHLYNPASGSSVKLLESGLVKPMESAVGWTAFAPVTWKTHVSDDGRSGTVTTGHGETFSVTIEENPDQKSIMDWYLENNPGTLSSQAVLIETKSGLKGLEGADLLTTYFPWQDYVLVFKYQLNDQPFVNFRQTYEMMKNSIQLKVAPALPELESSPVGVEEQSLSVTEPSDSVSLPPEEPITADETPAESAATSSESTNDELPDSTDTPPQETETGQSM